MGQVSGSRAVNEAAYIWIVMCHFGSRLICSKVSAIDDENVHIIVGLGKNARNKIDHRTRFDGIRVCWVGGACSLGCAK
jgi:hypothetical protein